MDCIYCECGKTTNLTTERKEYFPTALAIQQIDEALKKHPRIDYITFSGAGEPYDDLKAQIPGGRDTGDHE